MSTDTRPYRFAGTVPGLSVRPDGYSRATILEVQIEVDERGAVVGNGGSWPEAFCFRRGGEDLCIDGRAFWAWLTDRLGITGPVPTLHTPTDDTPIGFDAVEASDATERYGLVAHASYGDLFDRRGGQSYAVAVLTPDGFWDALAALAAEEERA
jgi:hypothetical protein